MEIIEILENAQRKYCPLNDRCPSYNEYLTEEVDLDFIENNIWKLNGQFPLNPNYIFVLTNSLRGYPNAAKYINDYLEMLSGKDKFLCCFTLKKGNLYGQRCQNERDKTFCKYHE